MPAAQVERPTLVAGRTVLEPGAPVVWFTFPGAWHDIGRFHTADGRLTGYYANILTPVQLEAPGEEAAPSGSGSPPVDHWRTTDLFLDVFLDLDGEARVLDRDEFDDAVDRGWITGPTARAARAEVARLLARARSGRWPPALVHAWPLDRARAAAR